MHFIKSEDGVMSTLLVVLLPAVLFAVGLAVDLTSLDHEKQYVQGQADVGALSAAASFTSPDALRSAARRTVAQNRVYHVDPLPDRHIEIGTLVSGRFTPVSNQQRLDGANAVRVTVTSRWDMYILSMFVSDENAYVTRSAVAIVDPRVSFALTNCLLNVKLLSPALRPIIGGTVDVLCSGRGVDTDLDAASFLGGLKLRAHALTPSGSMNTYGDILDAEYSASDIMSQALGTTVVPNRSPIRLGDVLFMSEDLRRVRIGAPIPPVRLRAADVVLASAALLQERIVDAQVGVNLGSFGNVAVKVHVSDPPRIVVGVRPGDPEAYAKTAQIGLEVPALNIANIFSLKLNVEVAHASARLTARGQTCSTTPSATVAVFDPVTAGLLHLEVEVKVLGLPISFNTASSKIGQIVDGITTTASFTRQEYVNHTPKVFGPSTTQMLNDVKAQIRTLTGGLLSQAKQAISAIAPTCTNPLGCLLNATLNATISLVNGVVSTLGSAIPNVTNATGTEGGLVDAVLRDLLGLGIAQAELRLLDINCAGGVRLGL